MKGMLGALAVTIAGAGFIMWDDAVWLRAQNECTAKRRRIDEAEHLVPYQSVTLCTHGVTVSRDWTGWTCGCAP